MLFAEKTIYVFVRISSKLLKKGYHHKSAILFLKTKELYVAFLNACTKPKPSFNLVQIMYLMSSTKIPHFNLISQNIWPLSFLIHWKLIQARTFFNLFTKMCYYDVYLVKHVLKMDNRSNTENMSEWVSDCCLTPNEQFFSYIMERTSCMRGNTLRWFWASLSLLLLLNVTCLAEKQKY